MPHILDDAKAAITGDRRNTYGPYSTEASALARFWSEYLEYEITEHDVAMMMMLLKINRIRCGTIHRDNYVDLAGYAGLAADLRGLNTEPVVPEYYADDECSEYAIPAS